MSLARKENRRQSFDTVLAHRCCLATPSSLREELGVPPLSDSIGIHLKIQLESPDRQKSVVLAPHQGHISLQQMETFCRNHTYQMQKTRDHMEPGHSRYTGNTIRAQQGHRALWKRGGQVVRERKGECVLRICFLGMSEAKPLR